MSRIDTSRLKEVGASSNTRYYSIEEGVVLGIPHDGARDDEASARQNVEFQCSYFRDAGRGGVVVIDIDPLTSQDKGARRVYQAEPDPEHMRGTALVGGKLLARAIGSFFLGLSKPRIPIKMCADLDGALAWAREINREHESPGRSHG